MRGWIRVSTVAPGLAILLVPATVQDVVLLAMASLVLPIAAYWLVASDPRLSEPGPGASTVNRRAKSRPALLAQRRLRR